MPVIQTQDITISKSVLYGKALSRQCMYLFILLGCGAHQAVYGGSGTTSRGWFCPSTLKPLHLGTRVWNPGLQAWQESFKP